jgi:tetratricopeptide (TPR) repeat protein/DNA-binding CsgD family transcriptional regulator
LDNPENMAFLQRLQAILTNKGNIYGSLGAHEKSLEAQLDALRLAETAYSNEPENKQNFATLLRAMNNTAVVYWRLDKMASARNLLDQALMLGRDSGFPENIGFTLNNIGLIQIDEGEFKQAIDTYTEALAIAEAANDMHGIGGAYNNLGLIMEQTGDQQKAVSYYLASLKISESLKYSDGIANTCANIGRIYSQLNQPDSALYYANRGIEETKASGSNSYLLNNYETIYRVYEKTGQPKKAFNHYKQYVALKDSMFNIENSKQIAEMEARFQNEKKEQENRLLRQDVEIMNQRFIIQRRNNLLLVVGVAGLFLMLILLFNFYRLKNRTLKQRTKLFDHEKKLQELEMSRLEDQLFAEQEISRLQNEKLEQKNRELSSQVLHTIQKNDIIQNMLQEIEALKSDDQELSAQCYIKISNLVKGNTSLDKDWDQFKRHFDEVNPAFFSNLQDSFPDLSSSELKLCAYYRINLDTKEISRILNISPAAVQKSRHRLRKKMNIPSEVELNEFMSRF